MMSNTVKTNLIVGNVQDNQLTLNMWLFNKLIHCFFLFLRKKHELTFYNTSVYKSTQQR